MTAPEIPDEAVQAADAAISESACDHNKWGSGACSECDTTAALDAAWPHLYAAALRHASQRIWDLTKDDPLVARNRFVWWEVLREWADEALDPQQPTGGP